MSDTIWTAGVDVGTSAVKAVLVRWDDGKPALVAHHRERIHRRDPSQVGEVAFHTVLDQAFVRREEIAYVASTGEGDDLPFRDGHFYGMTTHARGATHLLPGSSAVVDIGALHARVMVISEDSRVLRSKMTSQCAAGTGQFLENIARYLGIRADEIGPLSLEAQRAEVCSGICAVLSETDVINMVSRGVPKGEILRGVHDSIAQRLARLLRSAVSEGKPSPLGEGRRSEAPRGEGLPNPPSHTTRVAITGGLAADTGLKAAIERQLATDKGAPLVVETHPQSVVAGALGAALWGHHRHLRLAERSRTQREAAA